MKDPITIEDLIGFLHEVGYSDSDDLSLETCIIGKNSCLSSFDLISLFSIIEEYCAGQGKVVNLFELLLDDNAITTLSIENFLFKINKMLL
tara:strand:- start:150 stop:422 length:273 start_codon:yes stop_codon:yes gene_type:complete